MSAQSTQARDIPGLTRVRMLMHELKGDELQEIAALDLWSATGCGLLRESSAAADSARNAVLSTFRQTWPVSSCPLGSLKAVSLYSVVLMKVAREVFTANGPSAAGAERGLQSKDISTLALGFIQVGPIWANDCSDVTRCAMSGLHIDVIHRRRWPV